MGEIKGVRYERRLLKPDISFFKIIKAFLLDMSKLVIDIDFCHYTDKRGNCSFMQLPWSERDVVAVKSLTNRRSYRTPLIPLFI